jgi:hypothetical protein
VQKKDKAHEKKKICTLLEKALCFSFEFRSSNEKVLLFQEQIMICSCKKNDLGSVLPGPFLLRPISSPDISSPDISSLDIFSSDIYSLDISSPDSFSPNCIFHMQKLSGVFRNFFEGLGIFRNLLEFSRVLKDFSGVLKFKLPRNLQEILGFLYKFSRIFSKVE